MTASSQPPQREVVTAQETGRSCPYCRFPLKQGIEIARCGVCAAPHHADCWSDNGGCAVVACAGGPQSSPPAVHDAPTSVQPAVVPSVASQAAAPPPPPPGGSPGSRWTGPWIVAAAVVLGLALAGGALAVALTGKSSVGATQTIFQPGGSGTSTDASAGTADGSTGVDAGGSSPAGATDTQTSTDAGATPNASTASAYPAADESAREAIQQMLLQHHQDIVDGDYRGAWDLLSKRKQNQKLHEPGGYQAWAEAQRTQLTPYLIPSGLHVEFADYDRATGVAQVDVTGMGWTRNTCGGRYEGLTWVKYEDGAWRYDPGYSTTPERARIWSRRPQPYYRLLGTRCE